MIKEVLPGQRSGEIRIPASKSVSHRMLILAALGDKDVTLKLEGISADIKATAECLAALGAGIREAEGRIEVSPIKAAPSDAGRRSAGSGDRLYKRREAPEEAFGSLR